MKVFSVAYPFSVFSFLITSAATSCAATVESNPLGCIEAEEPDTDYFPDKVEIKYSTLWRVTYHNTYKVLFNDATETVYLLYQCGTTPPDPEQVVQQGQAPYINSTLSIPLKGFALQTTTSLAHIEWLGLSSTFKAYLGSRSSISSPCINDRFDSGDLVHIPDWQNETELQMGYAQTGIDPQDMVPPVNPTGSFLTADLNNKVFIAAYKEQTNNALGEWHKYYAVLTNTEKKATEDFEGISSRFECTARNARFLQELAPDDAPKPKVVWAEFAPWCNNAWSIVNCPDEPCEFIEKCDAELLQGQGSVSVEGKDYCEGDFTTEEFVEFAKDADYWIYPGHGTHYWELVYADHPELDQLKAVQNKQVFDTVRTGLSTWYEHRMTEYDLVLEDICNIMGHLQTFPPHTNKFMRNVFTDPIGDLGQCEDYTNAYPFRADDCVHLTHAPTKAPVENPADDNGDRTNNANGDSGANKGSVLPFLAATVVVAVGSALS